MSYSGYASKIESSKGNLDSNLSNIESIDFASVWEGSAATKQISNIENIMSSFDVQSGQLSSLANALNLIDEYDNAKQRYDNALSNRNELNTEADNYSDNYNRYTGIMNDASTEMTNLESQIDSLLGSISESYSSNITVIPATPLTPTTDAISNINSISASFGTSFDLSNTVVSSGAGNFSKEPNFSNTAAWISENPYAANYMGQCTWFAWGRFYEMYGYSPGFTGNGYECVGQLLNAHGDKFYKSSTPVPGAVFSTNGVTRNHVGIIIDVNGDTLTIQDGNYDGHNNGWDTAQSDWGTWTASLSEFQAKMGGNVVFANPR